MVIKIARKKKTQRGFTMVELLIALVILTIGLLAAAAMQATAISSNTVAHRHSDVTAIAQMVMDDLRSQYLSPDTGSPGKFYYDIFNPNPANPAQQILPTQNYDRFPPYNWESNPVLDPNYVVPGVGTFQVDYIVTTNTPARNISMIQVQIFRMVNGVRQTVPFTLIGHRMIPSS